MPYSQEVERLDPKGDTFECRSWIGTGSRGARRASAGLEVPELEKPEQ
jgi:hypothetical protein